MESDKAILKTSPTEFMKNMGSSIKATSEIVRQHHLSNSTIP